MISLGECNGNRNTFTEISGSAGIPNQTEDVNLGVFNLITRKKESKALTKHISYKCKSKFESKKRNSKQNCNKNKCRWKCKNPRKYVCEKGYIWNRATSCFENGRYAEIIIGNSAIMCDKIIETAKSTLAKTVSAKSIPTNPNEKKVICKINNFYILLAFLLITMILLKLLVFIFS